MILSLLLLLLSSLLLLLLSLLLLLFSLPQTKRSPKQQHTLGFCCHYVISLLCYNGPLTENNTWARGDTELNTTREISCLCAPVYSFMATPLNVCFDFPKNKIGASAVHRFRTAKPRCSPPWCYRTVSHQQSTYCCFTIIIIIIYLL